MARQRSGQGRLLRTAGVRRRPGALLAAALLSGALAGAGGCQTGENGRPAFLGYTVGPLFDDSVRTIHVEMFTSREFRRDLEFQLTEALIKRIEMDTPYRIADRKLADTLISGEVLEVRQGTLGRDFRTDLPIETAATFVVSFRWQDARTGRILLERQRESFTTTYIRPVGETFADGAVRGLDGLAEQIVETMESPW